MESEMGIGGIKIWSHMYNCSPCLLIPPLLFSLHLHWFIILNRKHFFF